MAMKTLTQPELVEAVLEATDDKYEFTAAQVKDVLKSLEAAILDSIEEGKRVKLGNIVTIGLRLKKASKARMGRNPQTGEDVKIAAKPASVVPKVTANKDLKELVAEITTQKAKRWGA